MANPIIEQNCIFTHEGKSFQAGGAVISDKVLIAYVGKLAGGRGFNGQLGSEHPWHELTDWHGNKIGTIRLTSSWSTPRSYVSSRMYQGYATVNGNTYTGRTAGKGMSFKGKPVKG